MRGNLSPQGLLKEEREDSLTLACSVVCTAHDAFPEDHTQAGAEMEHENTCMHASSLQCSEVRAC